MCQDVAWLRRGNGGRGVVLVNRYAYFGVRDYENPFYQALRPSRHDDVEVSGRDPATHCPFPRFGRLWSWGLVRAGCGLMRAIGAGCARNKSAQADSWLVKVPKGGRVLADETGQGGCWLMMRVLCCGGVCWQVAFSHRDVHAGVHAAQARYTTSLTQRHAWPGLLWRAGATDHVKRTLFDTSLLVDVGVSRVLTRLVLVVP
jgi:hypothetical protein